MENRKEEIYHHLHYLSNVFCQNRIDGWAAIEKQESIILQYITYIVVITFNERRQTAKPIFFVKDTNLFGHHVKKTRKGKKTRKEGDVIKDILEGANQNT